MKVVKLVVVNCVFREETFEAANMEENGGKVPLSVLVKCSLPIRFYVIIANSRICASKTLLSVTEISTKIIRKLLIFKELSYINNCYDKLSSISVFYFT